MIFFTMAEQIANRLGKSMKKGFINILILIVLEKGPAHGYLPGAIAEGHPGERHR